MSEQTSPEQSDIYAINLARRALALAREVMSNGPPGIDPMATSRAEEWREIRDEVDALATGRRS